MDMKTKRFNWRSPLSIMHYALCILMLSALSMSVSSCKDDDDDKDGRSAEEIAQDPYEKESEAGNALYRLLSQLSVCDSLPDNWKTATFEPRIGMVLDQSQPRVRTISVNDVAEAVARYNSLTGKNLPETTTSDTYKVDDIGTLSFTAGGTGTVAIIDVNVKQLPQLQQLRMVKASDIGENGSFSGDAYYRFGDVVQDKNGCYWICARPAYSPDKKEDTHWFSFQIVEKDNLKNYTKKGCKPQTYPVSLGVQKEKMQYLVQLLSILANPNGYATKAGTAGNYFGGKGLGGLNEDAMTVEDLKLQATLWDKKKIWDKVKPASDDHITAQTFKNSFTKPVSLIYEKGSTSGKELTIPVINYTGAGDFFKNKPVEVKIPINMEDHSFNITMNFTKNGTAYSENWGVPDAYVVRYKTGYQLSSNWLFTPDATKAIPGVTEVYRFNAEKDNIMNEPLETPVVGCFIGKDGKYYASKAIADQNGGGAVAIVVYYNKNDRVDSKMGYHGLAMALQDAGKAEWGHTFNLTKDCLADDDAKALFNARNSIPEKLNGILSTQWLATGTCGNTNHPAAQLCYSMDPIGKEGFSRWFLPAAGHWIKALTGMGMTWEGEAFKKGAQTSAKILEKYLSADGCQPLDGYYWSSTEEGKEYAWCLVTREKLDPYEIDYKPKGYDWKVRAFLAFDNSGQQNVDYGVDKAQAKLGYILATNGKFYKDQSDLMASGQTGAAIVVYMGDRVESGENYTGLALALKSTTEKYTWGGGNHTCNKNDAACDMGFETDLLNGLATTKYLSVDKCPDCGGTHPVFQATKTFQPTVSGAGFSPWFVPSTGQWIKMLESFGAYTKYVTEQYVEENGGENFFISKAQVLYIYISYDDFEKMRETFLTASAEWAKLSYWCANYFDYPYHFDRAWTFRMDEQWPNGENKDSYNRFSVHHFGNNRSETILPLRPMIAF